MRGILILLTAVSGLAFGQTGDAGSGWANNLTLIKQVKQGMDMLNTLKKTKDAIGKVAATVNDVKNTAKLLHDDMKNLSSMSETELEDIKSFFSFKESLSGKGYSSLLNLDDWYQSETSGFRDRSGRMNAASSIINSQSPQRALQMSRGLYTQMYRVRQQMIIVYDRQILEFLKAAKVYERRARIRLAQANVAILNKSMNDLGSFSGLFGKKESDADTKKPFFTQSDVNKSMEEAVTYSQLSNEYRNKAFQIYFECLRLQASEIVLAMDVQHVRQLVNESETKIAERQNRARSKFTISNSSTSSRGSDKSKWKSNSGLGKSGM